MQTSELTTLSGDRIPLRVETRPYVAGEFRESDETLRVEHPATGEPIADVFRSTPEDVDEAVTAAQRASDEWAAYGPAERRERVEELADVLERHRTELANLDVADNGSCISRMRHDVDKAATRLRYFAGLAPELKGEMIPTEPGTVDYTVREPYGVVASIIPFNHPAMFVAQKLAPALVAGNGIVLKPSEYTPLSALYIAHLIDTADLFPDGLVNVVIGEAEIGAELVEHPGTKLVTMVGSIETGKAVMKGAAETISPVSLELGGKNPNVVFPDADLSDAIDGIVDGMALEWQGQSCGSGTRLLVHDSVADEVVGRVVEEVSSVTIGDPFDEETTMGAIVSEPQYESVTSYLETAAAEGATVVTGGGTVEEYDDGYFVEPTVLEVEPEMTVAREETFGPILSVIRWEEYDRMIEIANGLEYGLTAALWTNDLRTAHQTAERLEAGYIWVNQYGKHYQGAPFGGYDQSGIGKTDNLQELLDHTREKNINLKVDGEMNYGP